MAGVPDSRALALATGNIFSSRLPTSLFVSTAAARVSSSLAASHDAVAMAHSTHIDFWSTTKE